MCSKNRCLFPQTSDLPGRFVTNYYFRVSDMTAVRFDHGLAMVRGQRYSGIAVEREDYGFFKARYYLHGMLTQNWLRKFEISDAELWIPETDERLEYDCDELALVNGEQFSGVVFEEDAGVLRRVCLYTKDTAIVDIETNKQGDITSIDCFFPGKYSFEFEKLGNGGLAALSYSRPSFEGVDGGKIEIREGNDSSASITFSGGIDKDLIEQLYSNISRFSVEVMIPKAYSKVIIVDCIVNDIAIESIRILFESIGFESAEIMTVFSMDAEIKSFLEIVGLAKVKKVVFKYEYNKSSVPSDLVVSINRAYPNLDIEISDPA